MSLSWSDLVIADEDVRQFHAVWLPPSGGRGQRILYALSRQRRVAVVELQMAAGVPSLVVPPELNSGNQLPGTSANPLFIWVLDQQRNRMQLRLYATVQERAGRWPLRYIDLPFYKPTE